MPNNFYDYHPENSPENITARKTSDISATLKAMDERLDAMEKGGKRESKKTFWLLVIGIVTGIVSVAPAVIKVFLLIQELILSH